MLDLAKQLSKELTSEVTRLRRSGIIVYEPTKYAWESYANYLSRYASGTGKTILLGMNPGPWGMAQTGVPFGAVSRVKWLKVSGKVAVPKDTHPAYPVHGFKCEREEVSGDRLWGMLAERFRTPTKLSKKITVLNYCPLLFLEKNGKRARNLALNKVSNAQKILKICDAYLAEVLELLQPKQVIGIGGFAAQRLEAVAPATIPVGQILHPSPASPLANRGFAKLANQQLDQLGVA